MFACSQAAAEPKLNPRTGLPYKRGGAYNTQPKAPSRAEKKADKLAAEKASKDKSEVVRLEAEVARLTSALAESQASIEAAKRTAMLEAGQKASEQLLQRYRDGLRDGASLSRGGLGSLSGASGLGSTPDSASCAQQFSFD